MSTVLRPIVNDDHVTITMKLDVKWADVPVDRRKHLIDRLETVARQEAHYLNTGEECD